MQLFIIRIFIRIMGPQYNRKNENCVAFHFPTEIVHPVFRCNSQGICDFITRVEIWCYFNAASITFDPILYISLFLTRTFESTLPLLVEVFRLLCVYLFYWQLPESKFGATLTQKVTLLTLLYVSLFPTRTFGLTLPLQVEVFGLIVASILTTIFPSLQEILVQH